MTKLDDDIADIRQSLAGVAHLIQTYQIRRSPDWLVDTQRPILDRIDELKLELADNQRAHESSHDDLASAERSQRELTARLRLLKDGDGIKKIRSLLAKLKRDLPEGTTIDTVLGLREGTE